MTELAGDSAKVYVATTAMQDVHHIQARPSLIAAARPPISLSAPGPSWRSAGCPCSLRASGDDRIQSGQPGNFEATRYVRMIEVPTASIGRRATCTR